MGQYSGPNRSDHDLAGIYRPHLPRYQYDPELLAKFTETARPALLDFVKQQNRWGGDLDRSVDDISDRITRPSSLCSTRRNVW